jgi:hypothetical protein
MRAALIAVALALLALAAAPAARAEPILGVSGTYIYAFDSESPEEVQQITRVTGLPEGYFLGAIDFRPGTAELYGVADQSSSLKALFKIDLASGVATQVGEKWQMLGQRTTLSMSFHPVTEAIWVSAGSAALWTFVDPDTAVASPVDDTSLHVGAVAWTGDGTKLYGFFTRDEENAVKVRGTHQINPVNGTAGARIGPEFPFNTPLQQDYAGLDISPTGNAYLTFVTSGGSAPLYSMNLATSIAAMPSGPVQLSTTISSVDESAGTATLTVQREAPTAGRARVDYSTFDGTATAGSDYTSTSGSLMFAPNQTSASFTVPIAADSADERGETFGVRLSRPVGGFVGERDEAAVTIVDPPVTSGGGGGGTGGGGTGGGGTGGAGTGGGTGGGGTGTGGGTIPDTTAPIVLLAPRERSSMRRPIAVRYSCSEACTTTLDLIVDSKTQKRLRLKSRTLGTATATLTAAGKGTASVKVTRAALKRLKRARSVKAKLRATSTDAAGNRTLQTAKILLTR